MKIHHVAKDFHGRRPEPPALPGYRWTSTWRLSGALKILQILRLSRHPAQVQLGAGAPAGF